LFVEEEPVWVVVVGADDAAVEVDAVVVGEECDFAGFGYFGD
jgi:hypothetical protein